jgi:type 1 glutamine amidotransferase
MTTWEKVNGVYPLAWCHETDGGRRFYTSLGHKIEHYSDPVLRNHLRGAIRWVLRLDRNSTQSVQP